MKRTLRGIAFPFLTAVALTTVIAGDTSELAAIFAAADALLASDDPIARLALLDGFVGTLRNLATPLAVLSPFVGGSLRPLFAHSGPDVTSA